MLLDSFHELYHLRQVQRPHGQQKQQHHHHPPLLPSLVFLSASCSRDQQDSPACLPIGPSNAVRCLGQTRSARGSKGARTTRRTSQTKSVNRGSSYSVCASRWPSQDDSDPSASGLPPEKGAPLIHCSLDRLSWASEPSGDGQVRAK